ncbi:putative SAM-dependent methyltransferase [Planktothrix agardhii]|uniref:class I SAM-dependent methyltransferase n=1 Tax=Planktothrix agardhii TaxID=1160 RepID=UPI001BA0764F|nr:class I SAM-dependent methyltransferase [Planktothrix agardhii]CAD0231725.1 putative SAM-dependent methyltransferase [Planktothrix agardhii]
MPSKCRFCGNLLNHTFVDLGMSPLSNAYLKLDTINKAEKFYPLHTYVCDNCFLVQLEEFETPDHIFSDYAYFSSYSETWLRHAENYTELMTQRFGLNANSQVIEIASNDGYLLQYFQKQNIPVLGIEPAANVAKVAEEKGIPSLVKFFGVSTAQELVNQGKQADLLLGNNVLAHVPDLNDFVAGMKILLKPDGILTMEFPHVLQLILQNQFDTIYHEHFSYFSFLTVEKVFATHGLTLFDVEELPTHGGSLRIYGQHNDGKRPISDRVSKLKSKEKEAGLEQRSTYLGFGEQVKATKRHLLSFLIDIKNQGKSVVGYGAPAKGNTLLNYCGIRTDLLDYTVDRSPYKQGLFLPGTHIPIYHPDKIMETKPDYLLILPWNIKDEIIEQMSHIREWGGKFVVPIPKVEVID